MIIVFGTRFCGKVATVNNQWIETNFFSILFIPIFPVGSMFVTSSEFRKRKGLHISTNSQSVIAVYGRVFSLILALCFLSLAYGQLTNYLGVDVKSLVICLLVGCIFSALCIYFYFFYGKATQDDILLRNKVGHLTRYYALPNWFSYLELKNMLKSLELQYKQKYPDNDWKADLMDDIVDKEKQQLLYGIALFNCMVFDLPENDELYAKADQLYVLNPESILY